VIRSVCIGPSVNTELRLNVSRFNAVCPRQHGRQSQGPSVIFTHLISRPLPNFLLANSFSFLVSMSFSLVHPGCQCLPDLSCFPSWSNCTEIVRCHFTFVTQVSLSILQWACRRYLASMEGVCVHHPSAGWPECGVGVWNLDRAWPGACPSGDRTAGWWSTEAPAEFLEPLVLRSSNGADCSTPHLHNHGGECGQQGGWRQTRSTPRPRSLLSWLGGVRSVILRTPRPGATGQSN
jgi:hypothetical protein